MISVHESGHFIPGMSRLFGNDFIIEPRRIGLSTRCYILELTQTTYLDKAETPCLSSGDYYPVSNCIRDYVMGELYQRNAIALSLFLTCLHITFLYRVRPHNASQEMGNWLHCNWLARPILPIIPFPMGILRPHPVHVLRL